MAKRINAKLVLELLGRGMSAREIYRTRHISQQSVKKVLRKFAGFKVLVIDEWLIDKPTTEQMHFLLELTELHYDNSSTTCCSQYSNKDWHRRMGGGTHAESVMDRIVHNAMVIAMGEVNMRELTMGKSI